MYIILKTDESFKTTILHNGEKAHYFYAENLEEAQNLLKKIENTENSAYWSEYNASPDLPSCKEFNHYLKQILLEQNKITKTEMQELCFEAQRWFPHEIRNKVIFNIESSPAVRAYKPERYYNLKDIWSELADLIDRYTQTKNNISPWDYPFYDFNPIREMGLRFHFPNMNGLCNQSLCGVFNMRFYKFIYYFDFLDIKIEDSRLRDFWNFYKKTLNVYSITVEKNKNYDRFNVIPKPDEISVKNAMVHYSYDNQYFCDGIRVEKWLYDVDRNNVDISVFDKIENVDYRSLFIKKAGIENFIQTGEIIDTWENYPENEWWAKSEYKLIDMKQIMFKEITTTPTGRIVRSENYDYAPFLYMKNQTTGEYHLEGVSPDCKNLYDALKMRYKGLNLPSYDVKDIK